jgi:hypothetical protein
VGSRVVHDTATLMARCAYTECAAARLYASCAAKTREKEILALHYALLSKATGATP